MRRTPSSGCYWGFVLCLRDTLYLFLAIAIIAYAIMANQVYAIIIFFIRITLFSPQFLFLCILYIFFFLIIYSAY